MDYLHRKLRFRNHMGIIDQSSWTKFSLYTLWFRQTRFFILEMRIIINGLENSRMYVSGTRKVFRFIQFCNCKSISLAGCTVFWNHRRLCKFPWISHFNGEIYENIFYKLKNNPKHCVSQQQCLVIAEQRTEFHAKYLNIRKCVLIW